MTGKTKILFDFLKNHPSWVLFVLNGVPFVVWPPFFVCPRRRLLVDLLTKFFTGISSLCNCPAPSAWVFPPSGVLLYSFDGLFYYFEGPSSAFLVSGLSNDYLHQLGYVPSRFFMFWQESFPAERARIPSCSPYAHLLFQCLPSWLDDAEAGETALFFTFFN